MLIVRVRPLVRPFEEGVDVYAVAVLGVEYDAGGAEGAGDVGFDEDGSSAVLVVEHAHHQAVDAAGVGAVAIVVLREHDGVAVAGDCHVPRHRQLALAEVE